ncbi:hypothetical protein H257_09048 [Aphanomyces astaci]|uniref:HSF-type DNA-binding domain-containing protein n=2 Tax=Aphanomyces astaci TaxID=112090 RepID=W4GDM8_APHAT|nr:hypothetical protein H257_09048 [Aphanomyces astaci]ETV77164.1 hypothetical protein H257_09048 [Aphanomyces astaci]|eukprot:XP_009833470.1 hypothetical protein H257_09048 [Aphanomyces astaci]
MHCTSSHQPPSSSSHTSNDNNDREVAPFLRTLRTILTYESDDIIRWTPDGLAFEVIDMEALTSAVLPHYFKHNKYSSFQRQLNYFHFLKGPQGNCYIVFRPKPYMAPHTTPHTSGDRLQL